MIVLTIIGLILFFIKPIVGAIYLAAIMIAVTIGLIIKEEKNKRG